MLQDRVSNPGPLTYESGALPIALRGPAIIYGVLAVLSAIGLCNQYEGEWVNRGSTISFSFPCQ